MHACRSTLEDPTEDAGRKGADEWKAAASRATARQRQLAVLDARRNLLAACQGLRATTAKVRMEAPKKAEEARKALAKAEADVKQPPSTNYTKRNVPSYPTTSTGRRLAFARWIADRANPLTARVAVNQMWLRHFGQALVPSVADFGRNGRPPSHPALLDWLAVEFMDQGWHMKALHRLLVTSSTYRQASTSDPADVEIDRDNKYLWRMPSRRVEAEVVRDCLFYVAGRLDESMGGRDIPHEIGLTNPRRSLYFRHASEKQMEFLKIFDCAAVTECYQRKESIGPQQALALANSELAWTMAQHLARILDKQAGDAEAFTVAAFERVLSRPPTPEERAECSAFLARQPRANLVHVLLNHHEFVTIR